MMTRRDQLAMRKLHRLAEAEVHWLCCDPTGKRPQIPEPYLVPIGVAFGYAKALAEGREPACQYTRKAARRFLSELEEAARLDSRWRFCPGSAAYVSALIAFFQQTKGGAYGERLVLMPWQLLFLAAVFGFHERRTGLRKYRRAACWLPKSNGKTTLLAALACIVGFGEGEQGAETVTTAGSLDQAKLCFDTALQMLRRDPLLSEYLGELRLAQAAITAADGSTLKPIGTASAPDGLNCHCAIFDEVGMAKSRAVWDAIATQSAKRTQPLVLSISTCGDAVTGLGRQLYDHALSVLDGQTRDERFFVLVFAADETDDPWHESTWQKANPGWGVTVHPEGMKDLATQAQANPQDRAAFLSRNLNLWQASGAYALYSAADWQRCYDSELRWSERKGQRCYLGADLAFRDDLCSITAVFFDREDDPVSDVAVFSWSFLPASVLRDKAVAMPMLREWEASGHLVGTDGSYTDLTVLTDKVAEIDAHATIMGIAVDPWHAALWIQQLKERLSVPILEYRQSTLNMSLPAKLLGELIAARRLYHDGNPVLAWCIANVVSREDGRGNLLPRKSAPDRKIDAAVALIMALGLGANEALRDKLDGPIYRDKELLVF